MNPAALKTNLKDLPKGGTLIVNRDAFSERNLEKAGYTANPLEDGSLDEYRAARDPADVDDARGGQGGRRDRAARRSASKNMFALGLMSWLYTRPTEATIGEIRTKFAKRPEIAEANIRAFKAGYAFGETTEVVRGAVRGRAGEDGAGRLPEHHRQPGARARAGRRERQERLAALPRRLPDHAGLGDPRGTRRLQALRRPHLPGRGRDRRRRRGPGRLLRRRARRLARRAAPGSSSSRRRSASRSRSSCRWSSSTSSGPGLRPGCRRSRSRPTCSR